MGTDLTAVGRSMLGDRPFTMAVLGDSTGALYNDWVYLLGRRLAELGRQVTIHDWSIDTNSYTTQSSFGPNDGAPIVIWNASASGKPTQYNIDNWDRMVPVPSDFYIINHGHNELNREQAVGGVGRIVQKALPSDTAVVLQNPRLDDAAGRQADIVAAQRDYFMNSHVALFDVFGAFSRQENPAQFLNSDGFRPNDAGEALWAETIERALGVPLE